MQGEREGCGTKLVLDARRSEREMGRKEKWEGRVGVVEGGGLEGIPEGGGVRSFKGMGKRRGVGNEGKSQRR